MRFKILVIACLFFSEALGQHYDFVKILPGQGILYNNDSIILNKTTINELHKKLEIKDVNPCEYTLSMWSGEKKDSIETASGKEYIYVQTAGSKWSREIIFKSIKFEFADETDENNLKLRLITIQSDKTLKINTDNGFMMGMTNPNFKDSFPNLMKNDYISKNGLRYDFYTYGISFQLEKAKNDDLKIIEISVY